MGDFVYDGNLVLDAWKKAVNSAEICADETILRPEIARSWARCARIGLDPWSSGFPRCNNELLQRSRNKYKDIMEAASPVMQYLLALFGCNVSLADNHGFVFDLITPMSAYPRTLGTYCIESLQGTGNLPLAIIEDKPVRVDGREHFRAVSQSYSGVTAIIRLSGEQRFFLNLNDPFSTLPQEALEICVEASGCVERLYGPRRERFSHLSSASFFDPLLRLPQLAVIVTDEKGGILTANEAAERYVKGYAKYPYAEKPLQDYLRLPGGDLSYFDKESNWGSRLSFRSSSRQPAAEAKLLRSTGITLENGDSHRIIVMEPLRETSGSARPGITADAAAEKPGAANPDYVWRSEAWKKVDSLIQMAAPHKSHCIIMGETGTGKEVVARELHRLSGRKGPFVALNCAALPRDLLSSELFGYEGGAFTGARSSGAKGKFEYANGGTLFLDEIGDMPIEMQPLLLRVIQEKCVTRVGGNTAIPVDVRIVSASNQNMLKLMDEKKFRRDLWYRLSAIEIYLPPLREREGDVSALAEYFNRVKARDLCLKAYPLSEEVLDYLESQSWPGNVRELQNRMEKALIVASNRPITLDCFYVSSPAAAESRSETPETAPRLRPAIPGGGRQKRSPEERDLILSLLEEENGNISRVAARLGIARNTLYRRIEKYGIRVQTSAYCRNRAREDDETLD